MMNVLATLSWPEVWRTFVEDSLSQRALAGGLGVALSCSLLSVFVVLKRMAFIGQGISHAAFGGFAVALLAELALPAFGSALGRDGVVAAFCIVTALVIGAMTRRVKVSEDTAIGIALVAAMALGVLLLDVRKEFSSSYTPSLHSILFGDIFFLKPAEIWAMWILAAAVIALTIGLFKELVFFTFDEEAARAFGVRTGLLYYGLLIVLALAVVAAMRSVGVILATALLILPGASGRMWANRVGWMAVASVLIALGGVVAGFFLSLRLQFLSTEPVIVLVLCALFVLSHLVRSFRQLGRRENRKGEPAA
jgi:ABC-type Mn2+/Zn2+ transport system permease subunit